MAWSVPKLGTLVESASGNFDLIEPAGVAQGDLMIACIAYRGNAAITPPSGWAACATAQNIGDLDATNGIASGAMFYIVRGASAPALTCTRTAGDVVLARVISYSGNTPTPLDTGTSNTLAVASTTVTPGSLITAEAGELIVAMASGGDAYTTSAFDATDPSIASGATNTTTAPTAGTWIERHDSNTATGADCTLAIADAIRATAGSTGAIQCTMSGAARSVMIAAAFKASSGFTQSPTDNLNAWADDRKLGYGLLVSDTFTLSDGVTKRLGLLLRLSDNMNNLTDGLVHQLAAPPILSDDLNAWEDSVVGDLQPAWQDALVKSLDPDPNILKTFEDTLPSLTDSFAKTVAHVLIFAETINNLADEVFGSLKLAQRDSLAKTLDVSNEKSTTGADSFTLTDGTATTSVISYDILVYGEDLDSWDDSVDKTLNIVGSSNLTIQQWDYFTLLDGVAGDVNRGFVADLGRRWQDSIALNLGSPGAPDQTLNLSDNLNNWLDGTSRTLASGGYAAWQNLASVSLNAADLASVALLTENIGES